MRKIIFEITNLNKQLSKHPDVNTVYRHYNQAEVDRSVSHFKMNVALASFRQNLAMISSLYIDTEVENKPTVNVITAARECYDAFELSSAITDFSFNSDEESFLFIDTSAMLTIFCVNCQISRRISTIFDKDLNIKNEFGSKYIFRGHSNASYKLIPSIYRNISIAEGFGVVNEPTLRNIYQNSKLIEKYKTVFGSDQIDYEFCAFAQHAKSFSPLLDFTDDIKVALSFATSNTNQVNDYLKMDAALYCLSLSNYDIRDSVDLGSIDIFINDNKISAFSVIRNKALFCCSYKDFEVEAFVLKDKTNDRMKYQKGCFLYFQRAVIISGNLLIPINYGRIRKYIIPAAGKTLTKSKIYKIIREKYNYYLPDYLMNPYKYFEEAPL